MKTLKLLFIVLLLGCQKEKFETKTTLVLGVENRQKLVRGWNDLTMLVIEKKDHIKIVSIPRDTLVYISPKGYWTINSLYLVLDIEGTVNYFNHRFNNLHIDNYIVYDYQKMFSLVELLKQVPGMPKKYLNLLNSYKYVNDWVRHRHKLRLDVDRQRRLHAFLQYVIAINKRKAMPQSIVHLISMAIKTGANDNNFSVAELSKLYYTLLSKPIEYHIWDGYHEAAYFKLQNDYSKRVFWHGEKTVYKLKHKNVSSLTSAYLNPYVFSRDEFFMQYHNLIPLEYQKPKKRKEYTTWNGGLLLNYKRLITDYQFTNQKWTDKKVYKFIDYYNCKLPKSDITYLIKKCRQYKINVWMAIVQMQKESSLINNNTSFDYEWRYNSALGYGCVSTGKNEKGQRIHGNWGYKTQVDRGLKCMRMWFDNYNENKTIRLMSYEGEIKPKNAATYSLYKYTPFYGEAVSHGHNTVGNRRFMAIWYAFKSRGYWK